MKSIGTMLDFVVFLLKLGVVLDFLTLFDEYTIHILSVKIKRNTEIVEGDNTIVTPLLKQKYRLSKVTILLSHLC